jgi:hypothetical protein
MHRRGGQISGVRSKHKFRPSLDQEEPARSLKCKIEAVVQLHFGVSAIGSWRCKRTFKVPQECRNRDMRNRDLICSRQIKVRSGPSISTPFQSFMDQELEM